GGRRAAPAGAGFALATLAGYLLSVWTGLFGFKEVRTGAGIAAGLAEAAAFAVLAALALAPAPAGGAPAAPAPFPAQIPPRPPARRESPPPAWRPPHWRCSQWR